MTKDFIQPKKQSGLYEITWLKNKKKYFGQASNVSNRISKHKQKLWNHKHSNNLLKLDFIIYKEESFEFNVLAQGAEWDNKKKRTDAEDQLIADYAPNVYNILEKQIKNNEKFGWWSDSIPIDKRKELTFAKDSGIYEIWCKVNDFSYFGHAGNVTDRIRVHIQSLQEQTHDNNCLQVDYDKYGWNEFEFLVLFHGKEWKPIETRLAKEALLMHEKLKIGKCYNHPIGESKSLETREKIKQGMIGVANTALSKPVVVWSYDKEQEEMIPNYYSSISDTAKNCNIDWGTVRNRIESKNYPDWKWASDDIAKQSTKGYHNKPRPCIVMGKFCASLTEASEFSGYNRRSIKEILDNGSKEPDWKWLK